MSEALKLAGFVLAGALASLTASGLFEILHILFNRKRRERAAKRSTGETIRAVLR